MEVYCDGAESVRRRREAGKCVLEDVGEVKRQVEYSLSRITQLVRLDT
jgi:hypothetical protein